MLSLGRNFNTPFDVNNVPTFDLITDVEGCLKFIVDEDERDIARSKIIKVMMEKNINKDFEHKSLKKIINQIHHECKTFLRKNENIVIVQSDKGNVTVAMKRSDYVDKMNALLSDTTTYKLITDKRLNPLTSMEANSNKLVNELLRHNIIDKAQKDKMIRHNSVLPRIYANPKKKV